MPLLYPKKPRHRRDRSLRTLDPSRNLPPSPPSPPALVHVVKVIPSPGEPTVATWVFDAEVEDPTGSVAGLVVDGHAASAWVRDDTQALRVDHGLVIAVGQSWTSAAGAGGIIGADGGALEAGSGTVEASP